MKVEKVYVGTLPPEVGPDGLRLIAMLENGRYETVLIDKPLEASSFAHYLRKMADNIEAAHDA